MSLSSNMKGSMSRLLAILMLFFGGFFTVAGISEHFIAKSTMDKIPVDVNQFDLQTSTGTGATPARIFDRCTVPTDARPVEDIPSGAGVLNANLSVNSHLNSITPSSESEISYQNAQIITINQQVTQGPKPISLPTVDAKGDLSKKPCNDQVFAGLTDLVTVDRNTGMSSNKSLALSYVSQDPTQAGRFIRGRNAIQYRFAPNVQQKTYPYFDPINEQTFDLKFDGKEKIGDIDAYHFKGQSPNVDLTNLKNTVTNYLTGKPMDVTPVGAVMTEPAGWWHIPNLDPATMVTLHKFAFSETDLWIDPTSGIILKDVTSQNINYQTPTNKGFYAKFSRFVFPYLDATFTSSNNSVDQAVNQANNFKSEKSTLTTTVPITLSVMGIIILLAGIFLWIKENRWNAKVLAYIRKTYFSDETPNP